MNNEKVYFDRRKIAMICIQRLFVQVLFLLELMPKMILLQDR